MKISVLQWNVWYQEKADSILKFLSTTNADIVCLQELTKTSSHNPYRNLPEEIKQLGYKSSYVMTVDRPGWQMGNGIFSKFSVQSSREVFLRHEVAGDASPSNESRAYIENLILAGDKRLTVGTAHLSFTPGFKLMPEKEIEAKHFLATIGDNHSGFIFTGDFNALPDSNLIRTLDNKFQHAGPDYEEPTWTTKPFDYMDFKADRLNWRLDYVYTTPDIKVTTAKTLATEVSDHLPILVEIAV